MEANQPGRPASPLRIRSIPLAGFHQFAAGFHQFAGKRGKIADSFKFLPDRQGFALAETTMDFVAETTKKGVAETAVPSSGEGGREGSFFQRSAYSIGTPRSKGALGAILTSCQRPPLPLLLSL